MTALGERVARSTRKAFATPWEVCFDLAYPPGWCMAAAAWCVVQCEEGQRTRNA